MSVPEEVVKEEVSVAAESVDSVDAGDPKDMNIFEELAGEILTDEAEQIESDRDETGEPKLSVVAEEVVAAEGLKEEKPAIIEEVAAEVETVQVEPVAEAEPLPVEVEQPPPQEPPKQDVPTQPSAEESAATRQKLGDTLAREVYGMSEDEVSLAMTEPDKVLPQLAAKVHMQVLDSAVSGIMANLPNMVNAVIKQNAAATEREDAFFQRWPSLKDHKDTVMKVIRVYREVNPGVGGEQAINDIGAQVSVMLKLPIDGVPAAVAAPAAREVVRPPPPAAPGGGSGAAPSAVPVSGNPFGLLAEEFLVEDLGD